MTPDQLTELTGLLSRIEAAGGPASVRRREGYAALMFPGVTRSVPLAFGYWSAADEALLIHALTLHLEAGGYRIRTVSASDPNPFRIWLYDGHDHTPPVYMDAGYRAEQYCRAWLRVWEHSTPAATDTKVEP